MAFDVQAARKAGYTDDEIADFLGNQSKFDVAGARKAGYTAPEIVGFLSQAANDAKPDQGLTPLDTEQVTSARPWQGAGAGRGSPNDPRRVDVERKPETFERPGFAQGFEKALGESERPLTPGGLLLRAADAFTGGSAQERYNKAQASVLDDKTSPTLATDFAKAQQAPKQPPRLEPRTDTISPTGGVVDALKDVPINVARSTGSTLMNFGALAAEMGLTIQSAEQFRKAAADLDKAKARTGLGVSDEPLLKTGTAADALIPSAKTIADYAPEGIKQLGMAAMGPTAIVADAGARGVSKAREDGLGLIPSLLYGAGQAATEGVPEAVSAKFAIEAAKRIPLGAALRGDAKAVTTAVQQTAQTMGVEFGSEQASALGNWVVDKIAADPTATPDRLVADMQEAVKATMVQGPTMLAGAKALQTAATGMAQRPQDRAARALADTLDSGEFDRPQVETLNPNLAIQRKTQEGLINIGAAQTVDDAIAAAANATTPQTQAVDNIARLLGETPDVSQPGNIPAVDSGSPGLGAPEPAIGMDAGVGATGAGARALDAGSAGNQPDGGAVPLGDGGTAPALSPEIADTASRIRELEGTPTTAAPANRAIAEPKSAIAQPSGEPASMWFGRRGDGYQTPEDASAALPSRQRVSPDLEWKVEQMPSGRYRLAGYDPQARQPAPTFGQNQAPGLINSAPTAINSVANDQNQPTREDRQAQAPAVEAPAPAGSDATGAPAVPAPAGPAQVEPAGVGKFDSLEDALTKERDGTTSEIESGWMDGKGRRQQTAIERAVSDAVTASVLDADAAAGIVETALKEGRADLALYAAQRAARAAESMSTTPGVSESSPKYEAIKNDLVKRKQKAQADAQTLIEKAAKGAAPATAPKTGDTITVDGKPAPAGPAQVEAAGVEPDYLTELFGSQEQQDAAQAKYVAEQADRKAAIQRIRDEIGRQKERATTEYSDWESRRYKANKTQVDLRGDGPSNQASMSIGAINESRRRNAMDALAKELGELDKLAAAAETESGAEKILATLTTLREKAAQAVKSGNWPGATEDGMFESMLLDTLKFRGPAGKGNVTSNGLSKAMLAAIKGAATNPPTQAQAGTPAEGAGESRPAPVAAPEPTAEQKIRQAFDAAPRTIGNWHKLTVEHNGKTQEFLANMKRVNTSGKRDSAIHLVNIRPGRLMAGDPLQDLAYYYKLDGKNNLVEEGIPSIATPEQLKAFGRPDPRLIPVSQRKQADGFENLLSLKSTKLILDDGRGRKLYDVQVTPAFRNRHFVNGRMPVVNGLELKHKADVTGVPSDNGWVLIDNREQLASRNVPKNQANLNTSAEPVLKTPESEQVGANDQTPKQYHDARLRKMSDDTGTPLAEVREFYDTEGGRAESDRLWSVMVDKRARDGATLTRQTLDKFYELNPTARLPETAFPNGYQRPDARKQEAIAKDAIRQDRREAKAARAASEEQTGPYGRDMTPIAQGGKPFKTKREADKFRKDHSNTLKTVRSGKGFALMEKTEAERQREARAARRLSQPNTGTAGTPLHAHGFIASEGGLRKAFMKDAGFDRNKQIGNRWLFASAGGLTIEKATEKMVEAGYLRQGASHNDAYNLIRKSVDNPQYTAEGWERIAEAEQEARRLAAMDQQNDDMQDFAKTAKMLSESEVDALDYAIDNMPELFEAGARLTAEEADAIFEEHDANNESAVIEGDQEPEQDDAGATPPRAGPRDRAPGGSQAGQGTAEEGLTAPTPEDIIARQERASRAAELDEQARLAREAQEANTPERQDKNLIAAVKLLVEYAGDTGNIYALAGRSGVDARVKVMAALQGVPRVPQAQAGVTALQDEFYRRAGVDPNQTSRRQELQFQAFVARVMEGDTAPALTAPTPAQVLEQQDRANRAEELDQREQIQREAAGQTLTQQTAPEQRKDNTGDMFGGPSVEDAERVREEKRKAEAEAKAKKDAESGQAPMFSRAAKEDPRDLIIQHNLTADNLLFAARMGGLPVPSLAITKAESPMKNFGEITLLGDVNMADPRQGIKAYGADIYSPRYPRVTYQFTPNMRARAEKQVKAGLDATNTYIDWSEVERDGADELNRQPALMWEFLTSKGITPTIVRVEPTPLDPAIQPFANDTRNSFELAQDPAFQAAAWTAHQEMLTQAYGDATEAQAEIEKMQQTARERGRSQVVNGYASGLEQYRRDKAVAGRVDTSATKRAMDAQIHDAGLTDEFRARNRQLMRDLAPNERMFQGYTYSGKRRYKPHTLDNVIAILKKELRGGENFNYGAGSLRAKFTPQFKSVAQIRANKDRLVSNAQFEAIKEEANNDLQMIAESLNKPTDTAIAIMEDAARMGLARAAAQYDVDLSDSQREMIGEYMTRLRNMPTEYFEGKLLRAVGIGEFKAAVVPENVSDDVLKLLDREGVTVFRYTGNRDGADRARAIQQAVNEIPGLMFSRTPAWRSELRDQIAAIKMESSKPEGWRAYIGGLTSKGVKPDEIEWSGITDWLKLQTGKVTKQQVLDYLDANGVQVQEVVLGRDEKAISDASNKLYDWAKSEEERGNSTRFTDAVLSGESLDSLKRIADGNPYVPPEAVEYLDGFQSIDTPTKYSQYTLPGGENYREVLLTLPDEHERRKAELFKFQAEMRAKYNAGLNWGQFATPEERAHARRLSDDPVVGYRSSHWDTPNVLAHIRLNDRVDSEGRRVLFVEEVQSDYGQEGKKKGFAPKNPANPTDDEVRDFFGLDKSVDAAEYRDEMVEALRKRDRAGTLPRAPFVTSTDKWLSLALKRIITMAAQEGYDRVAFVTGEQSAERYDLSKQVDRIDAKRRANDQWDLDISTKDGKDLNRTALSASQVEEFVGKDMAKKIIDATPDVGKRARFSGLDLKVGGEGMRTFYDRILPNTLKDVLKKVGGGSLEAVSLGAGDKGGWKAITSSGQEVTFNTEEEANQWLDQHGEDGEVEQVEGGAATQPGFTITPEMRNKAANGLPMFRPGSEAAGMPLAKAQSIVADLTKKWKNAPPIEVVATPSDLPMNAPDDARGVYWKGKVWIVAGPHKDRADIARTLRHEAVAHYGLRNILSADEWRQYMRNIQLAIKSGNKALIKIRDQVRSAYVDDDGKLYLTEQQEADEIAAKVAEQAVGPDGEFRPGFGFVKSVYAKIVQFLRELGLDVKLTLAEVQGMLVLAQKNLEAGKRTVGQGDVVVAAGRGDQALSRTDLVKSGDALEAGGSSAINRLNKVMQGAGWEIEYVDMDLTAEKPTANIRINRYDGRFLIAKVDSIGRGTIETFQRERGLRMDGSTRGRRPLSPMVDDVFLGRQKFEGARAMLRGMTNYLTDNATNPIALSDMRAAWAAVMNGPVRQDAQQLEAPTNDGAFSRTAKDQTNTPAFKAWFGDSVVTDTGKAGGKPLVVYHGTTADFNTFDSKRAGQNDHGWYGNGIYLSADPGTASAYTNYDNIKSGGKLGDTPGGSNVMPVYVALRNPYVWPKRRAAATDKAERDGLTKELQDAGYDGVIVPNEYQDPQYANFHEIVAFRPEQIKSAIGNRGSFDPADPNIMFSRGTTAEQEQEEQPRRPNIALRAIGYQGMDDAGSPEFSPGRLLYNMIGAGAGPLLSKWSLKAASPELRQIMRKMKIDVAKAQETAAAVAKESMALTEDERQMVSDLIEKELQAGTVPPEHAIRLAATINTVMGKQTDELLRLGMLSPESAERWRGAYLPRFYESKLTATASDLWADAVRKAAGGGKPLKGIRGKHLRGRGMYETIPVTQLADYETMGWEVRDPDYQPGLTDDGMVQVWRDFTRLERDKMGEIRDAGFRFVMGYMQTQKDIALGRMFEALATNPELSSKTATEELSVQVPTGTAPGTEVKTYGKLAGRYVSPETLSQLSMIEEAQSETLMMYRKAMGLWKEGKTVLNPVAHANNVISNITMAHFAGVSYGRVDKYLAAIRDFATKSDDVLEAKDAGLFLGTMNEAELFNTLPEELKALAQTQESTGTKIGRSAFNLLSFYLRKPMGWAYQAEDTFFRYLIYKDARGRGLSPDEAVDYAQKFIFTYDDLPKGARRIRDYGIPFFAYTYKAIPALLETALTHPERFAAPMAVIMAANAVAYAIAAGDDDDSWELKLKKYLTDPEYRKAVKAKEQLERELLPEWLKGNTSLQTDRTIRLGMDELTKLPMHLDISRMIPGGDMFDMHPNGGGLPWFQPLTPNHPLLSMYGAMFLNKDAFYGKDIVSRTDTAAEASRKRMDWMWKQMTPAIAYGNYHWERWMNALAQATGKEVQWAPEWATDKAIATGIGRDGLPVQPKLAAMQTFGIKARPYDLDKAEEIQRAMTNKDVREIEAEMRSLRRLMDLGAVSERTYDRKREAADEKKERLRDGLTVDGKPR